MHRDRAQGNEKVQDEQPRTVFVSGVEKCGMGNEVVD
jgi:hypothetical protein